MRAKFHGFSFEPETGERVCKVIHRVFYDLFFLTTLLTPDVCFFLPSTSINSPAFWTPTRCPTVQFSSDANYSELVSDSTAFKGSTITSDAGQNIRSPGHPHCVQLGYKVKDFPNPTLRFVY